ncbi:MAG TPA: TonB-dependent receptor [Pyrinomonadaceae bacterium]|nr:TonB-dependent receptor [Pyrinomonadaceae bacterium]
MRSLFSEKFRAAYLCALLMLAAVVSAAGQSPSGVEVAVKDANDVAVAGAKVELGVGGLTVNSAMTDQSGTVRFAIPKSGTYRISVEANGFATATREVSLSTGSNTAESFRLEVGGVSETVTVTATRTQVTTEETAVPVSVVGRREIEEQGINTIGDIFRTLPGTSTVNEGAFQVRPRIRGLDSNRVLILVDGERLNNSRTSTGQSGVETGLVDTADIESVEVVRGSGSVLYGTDALAGTINIITSDTPARRENGFRFGGRLDTFYSSNEDTLRGSLGLTGSTRYFAFRVAQSLERSGNYFTGKPKGSFLADLREQGIGITDEGEVLNSQSHGSNTAVSTRFFLNDLNTIKATYDRRRGANIGSAGLVGTFAGNFPFSNRDKVNLRYDAASITKDLLRLSVSGYYQKQDRNFTNVLTVPPMMPYFPGMYRFSETITDTRTSGADLQTDWKIGRRNTLTAGASFFRDSNKDSRTIIDAFTPTSPVQSIDNSKSVPDATLTNFAAFAQDEFRLTKRLKLTGGIRVDNFRTKAQPTTGFNLPQLRPDQIHDLGIDGLASGMDVSTTAVTGDFGAVYNLTNAVTLAARVGRSFRTPNIFEIFFTDSGSIGGFVVGNPRLKPETGVNFDATVRFKNKHFSASATYFVNNYENFMSTPAAFDSRGCPIFIVQPGTIYDADNCQIVSSPPGRSPVRVYQTQNVDRARIQGFEAEFEIPVKVKLGLLTPNGNFSYLRGDDTQKNVPLDIISPFRTNIGVRWQNFGRNYFFDYTARIVAEQKRLSPQFLLPVNQGGNGGPEPGFVTHNISGGYYFRRERFNFNINVGVSNLMNRAYSEQFNFAPARGRSFTIGTSWELK